MDSSDDDFEPRSSELSGRKRKEVPTSVKPEAAVLESSKVKRCRGVNLKARTSMFAGMDESEQRKRMADAIEKLNAQKKLVYRGMDEDMVERNLATLERFVCWTSNVANGVSRSEVKGQHQPYLKVSVSKSMSLMAHKVSLTSKLGQLYTDFDGNQDCSHLCHNRSCWRPEHLHSEDHAANMARLTCPGHVIIDGQGEGTTWIKDYKLMRT